VKNKLRSLREDIKEEELDISRGRGEKRGRCEKGEGRSLEKKWNKWGSLKELKQKKVSLVKRE